MSNQQDHRLALKPGTVLHGKYQIESVLGSGGFAITYLALDTSLHRRVAIKEMLPNDFATRGGDSTVVPKTTGDAASLKWALDRFIDEARVLARFDHPNIIRIHEQFAANQTAYMVTAYEEGRELNDYLRSGGLFKLADCAKLILPVLDGLKQVHAAGILHRDIKPGNLYIANGGRPVLLDFGSARLSIGAKTKDITTIVTPKYAPFEQYHTTGNLGPWTDIYSLGAVIHKSITGSPPPEAPQRERNDPYQPLAQRIDHFPTDFLAAIDWALRPLESDRPQSIEEWSARLSPTIDPDSFSTLGPEPSHGDLTRIVTDSEFEVSEVTRATGPTTGAMTTTAPRTVFAADSELVTGAQPIPTQRVAGNNKAIPIFIGAVAIALVGLGVYLFKPDTKGDNLKPAGFVSKPSDEVRELPDVTPEPKPEPAPAPAPVPAPDTESPQPGLQLVAAKGAVGKINSNVHDAWTYVTRREILREAIDIYPPGLSEAERKPVRASRVEQISVHSEKIGGYHKAAREGAKVLITEKIPADVVSKAFKERRSIIEQKGREENRDMTAQLKFLDVSRKFYDGERSGAYYQEQDLIDALIDIEPSKQ